MRREPDISAFLTHLPLFEGLPAAEIQRLAAATQRRKLVRGEVVFRAGERPTGFYAVIYGGIALAAPRGAHRADAADLVGPRRSFGEAIMFLDKPYIVTATAAADSLVLHVAKEAVFGALERNPRLALRMIASLSEKLHAAVREIDAKARGPGAQRFAAWLAGQLPQDGARAAITLPGTKKALAGRLGVSAEHLSRLLKELAGEGLIVVRGRIIEVHDPARLRERARS